MKKIISSIIIIFMLIVSLGGVVNAASASVSASSKSVEVGSTVKVTVSFGQKVSAAQFTLNFDTSKLEYVSKSSGGLFSAATKRYGYNSEDGVTADLASVTFTFKAKAEGTANVSVGGLKISNETQTGISASMANSSVAVTVKKKEEKPTVTPPTTGGTTGGSTNNNTGTTNGSTNSNTGSTNSKPSTNNNASSNTGSTNSKPSTNNNTSSNTGSTNKPSTNNNNTSTSNKNNTTTNKTENKVNKTEEKKEEVKEEIKEEVKQEENTIQTEVVEENKPEVIEPAPNKLIKLEDENYKKLLSEETKIIVKADSVAIQDGTILDVKTVNENDEEYKSLAKIVRKIKGNKMYFNIKLLKDNMPVQPNGYVTVYIPVPENFNKDRVEVYYINEETNSYEIQTGEIQGEYYSFTTNHFSNYVLIEKQEPKTFGQIVTEIFTNVIVLYMVIGMLIVIIAAQAIVIIRLTNKNK